MSRSTKNLGEIRFSSGQLWRALAFGGLALGLAVGILFAMVPEAVGANLLGYLLVQPIVLVFLIVAGLRSRYALGCSFPLMHFIKANGIAIALSAFLPAKTGEFLKPIALRRISNAPISSGFSMVFIERAADVIAVVSLAIFATYLGLDLLAAGLNTALFIGLAAAVLIACGAAFSSRRVRGFFSDLLRDASDTLSKKRNRLGLMLSTLALWLLSAGAMVVFGLASSENALGLKQLIIIFVASTVGLTLGVTPGGWGIVEGITVGFLLIYGLTLGESISFAIMFRVSILLLPAALAVTSLRGMLNKEISESDG